MVFGPPCDLLLVAAAAVAAKGCEAPAPCPRPVPWKTTAIVQEAEEAEEKKEVEGKVCEALFWALEAEATVCVVPWNMTLGVDAR